MTTIAHIIDLIGTLLPSLGVLAFLLIHRRQSIRADFEDTQLRLAHRQQIDESQTERVRAFVGFASSLAPAIMPLLVRLDPPKPRAADLSDDDLVTELERRLAEHGIPCTGFDDLLERLWAQGAHVTPPPHAGADPDEDDDLPPVATMRAADLS